jgi:drug/metabolite transporter (DMT)-like permease
VLTQLGHGLGCFPVKRKLSFEFWLTRIVPTGLLSAATMGAGNSVYLYLSVSFTQMLKALTPVYILLCLVLFRIETPKSNVVLAVFLMSFGTMIASAGELRFSWTGYILQCLADLFEGARLVLLQLLISGNSMTPLESMYFTAPATALGQLILVLMYETEALTNPKNLKMFTDHWPMFAASILLGIAINVVGMFVIKHTSGLMVKLLGIMRNNCLVVFAVIFMGEHTTGIQVLGYLLSIVGFIWYANLSNPPKHTDKNQLSFPADKYTRIVGYENEMDEL